MVRSASPGGPSIAVLLVDRSESTHELILRLFEEQDRHQFELEWCADPDAAAEIIREQRHQVYLVAHRLGEGQGLDLLRPLWLAGQRPAVVMLADSASEDVDLGDAALEVADVVIKSELDAFSLARKISHALARHRAINELSSREQRYQLAARAASDAIWDWDMEADRIYLSHGWYSILGREGRRATATRPTGSSSSTRTICCACAPRSTPISPGRRRVSRASTGCSAATAAGGG